MSHSSAIEIDQFDDVLARHAPDYADPEELDALELLDTKSYCSTSFTASGKVGMVLSEFNEQKNPNCQL